MHVGARGFEQGALQAAAGRLRGAHGEVLAGGLAHLLDEFGVVVGVDLEEVAGGGRRAAPRLGDDPGGLAVHRGAQGVGDGAVDGLRDERVDELQVAAGSLAGVRGVGRGEDAGGGEQARAAVRLVAVEAGEDGGEVEGDLRAEDGGGPGEAGGVGAESAEAGDEAAAAGRAVQVAQFAGRGLDRFELAVLHLGEEFHGLVRVAPGDRPDLAAERVVGVRAERVAGQSGGGLGRQGPQGGERTGRGGDRVEVAGALALGLPGAAGHHDQDGHLLQTLGERGQPVQGLGVGPVGVVDEEDQRPVAPSEPPDDGDQSVAHALGVGVALARLRDAEGGSGDVVPVAEVVAGLVGQQSDEGGLEQLPHDVEGDGPQGLAAARGPDGAAALGQGADPGQQRCLADARLARVHQQRARGRARAQGVDRRRGGGELGVPLPQGGRGGRTGPCLRHPVTSPGRPKDVQASSLVPYALRWRPLGPVFPSRVTADAAGRRPGPPTGPCESY